MSLLVLIKLKKLDVGMSSLEYEVWKHERSFKIEVIRMKIEGIHRFIALS